MPDRLTWAAAMPPGTYVNPVYDRYFADPFVLRADDAFYAYGTGSRFSDDRVFEVLRSTDLVTWESLGGALVAREAAEQEDYWAPEVAWADGRFYMYYSVGLEDRGHLLRVAVSDRPEGPFVDAGVVLTPDELFAIDPHPFQDEDGIWYLYYARDVLDGDRVGTTIAVDRLVSMTELAGEARTLLRASADWQLFRREREMYGSVYDWYTLEGPSVRRRDGRYYLFYSGGAWEEESYGVSYAAGEHPLGPFTEPAQGPTILRTEPGVLLGPGHSSLLSCPDGSDFIVYHGWDPEKTARRMCIDRLVWGEAGPERSGPTATPQLVPVCA